jgi:hypothetical protein
MRIPVKATRTRQMHESPRSGKKRRSQTTETSVGLPKSLSGNKNKRIWHNWLMEEN